MAIIAVQLIENDPTEFQKMELAATENFLNGPVYVVNKTIMKLVLTDTDVKTVSINNKQLLKSNDNTFHT
jgi:hypothetical protein